MTSTEDTVRMFLNGTAMSGFADHVHVAGAHFLGPRLTAPVYRFYAVRDEYPGLVFVGDGGVSIVGELYEMDRAVWRDRLLPNEPPELDPGEVQLENGTTSNVMLLARERVPDGDKVLDISDFGGWRAYVASRARGLEG